MNYVKDSSEFHDVDSICSGTLSHVPSQLAIVPSLSGMLSRDTSLRHDTWNLLGTLQIVFDSPRAVIDSSIKVLQAKTQCENGNLSLEVTKDIERLFQPRHLQGDHQP